MSTRIVENRVKMMKLWLKQGSRGLFAIDLNFQGLALKKPGTKMRFKPKLQGLACKREVLVGGFGLRKTEGPFCKSGGVDQQEIHLTRLD